jgi:hypothetical protein
MPLDQFAREGQCLEVRVPWLDVTLWLVPEEPDAEALGREGMGRGRIWTAEDLLHVMPLASGGTVPTISIAKLTMDGHIVEVSARERGDPDGGPGRGDAAGSSARAYRIATPGQAPGAHPRGRLPLTCWPVPIAGAGCA